MHGSFDELSSQRPGSTLTAAKDANAQATHANDPREPLQASAITAALTEDLRLSRRWVLAVLLLAWGTYGLAYSIVILPGCPYHKQTTCTSGGTTFTQCDVYEESLAFVMGGMRSLQVRSSHPRRRPRCLAVRRAV